jgi:RimJ/RimL family protein N-acetyltransferase
MTSAAPGSSPLDPSPILATPRLVLRAFRDDDLALLRAMEEDPRVLAYLDRDPEPAAATRARLERIVAAARAGDAIEWVIARDGERIGKCGLWRWVKEHDLAEIGFALLPSAWGQGYATEAVAAAVRFGFERLGLHRVEANVDPRNARSLAVLERLGFRREGVQRESWRHGDRYVDTVVLGLLASDPTVRTGG